MFIFPPLLSTSLPKLRSLLTSGWNISQTYLEKPDDLFTRDVRFELSEFMTTLVFLSDQELVKSLVLKLSFFSFQI